MSPCPYSPLCLEFQRHSHLDLAISVIILETLAHEKSKSWSSIEHKPSFNDKRRAESLIKYKAHHSSHLAGSIYVAMTTCEEKQKKTCSVFVIKFNFIKDKNIL